MIKKPVFRNRLPFFFPILLTVIGMAITLVNYRWDTFLVGWDNIYSELNFAAAFKMNISAIWQEYRGLGTPDVLSHAANLVHTAFLYVFSFFVPQNVLRYLYHAFCFLSGPLGMYILVSRSFHKPRLFAFIAGLFYMTNLITVQMFFAPLEVFSTHFAAIPWIAYALLRWFRYSTKGNALLLFAVSLFFTPQGFVPTVFIACSTMIGSLFLVELVHFRLQALQRLIIAGVILFCTNAFWLLPFVHSAITHGSVVQNTKINQLSSQNIFEKNSMYGDLTDVILLRGFMLNIVEADGSGQLRKIMQPWVEHINQPMAVTVSSFIAILSLIGVYTVAYDWFRRKHFRMELYMLPLFLIAFFMLGTKVPVLGAINEFMRDNVPLFGEAFRFPFTKYSFVYLLAFTVFFVHGLQVVSHWIVLQSQKQFRIQYRFFTPTALVLGSIIALVYLAWPLATGNLYYSMVRLKIPAEYGQIIAYFNQQPDDRRVMTLPQSSFWNWMYYTWGARGSGFVWYGIEQPTLERPFDPWSNYNEQYLNEVFYALEYQDAERFAAVIDKYDVSYIMIDEYQSQSSRFQKPDTLNAFFEEAGLAIAEQKTFGKMHVYKLEQQPFITAMVDPHREGSRFTYAHLDQTFQDYGNYIYDPIDWNTYRLFPSLFTNKTQEDLELTFGVNRNEIKLTTNEQPRFRPEYQYIVRVPDYNQFENQIPVQVASSSGTLAFRPPEAVLNVGGDEIPFGLYQDKVFAVNQGIRSLSVDTARLASSAGTLSVYTGISQILSVEFENGSTESASFSLDARTNPTSFTLSRPQTSPVSFSWRFLQPMQPQNIFKNRSYTIDSPCFEEIRRGLSVFNEYDGGFSLRTNGSTTCAHQYLDGVLQSNGNLLVYNVVNQRGKELNLFIDNPNLRVNVVETLLNGPDGQKFIIIPPSSQVETEDYGTHYLSESAGDREALNELNSLELYQLPFNWLTAQYIQNTALPEAANVQVSLPYQHPVKTAYMVPGVSAAGIRAGAAQNSAAVRNQSENRTLPVYLVASQAYNEGWLLFRMPRTELTSLDLLFPFFRGERVDTHVQVNNWANGWLITDSEAASTSYLIVYWPQYLLWFGYFLLVLCLIILLLVPRSRSSRSIQLPHFSRLRR